MAFDPIDTSEITAGKPNASTTWTKVQGNFDDHESRLLDLENGSAVAYPPIIFRVNGSYWVYGAQTNVLQTTLNFNITITGARLIIDTAGASGTTQIDILYKRGGGAWTSIFTTKPSVAYTAGSNATSSNAVLDSGNVALQAGDLIRVDITSVQASAAKNFMVRVDFDKTA